MTKLDLLKGYSQVPLTQCASHISAFLTPDCFHKYMVMPDGMCNAPATFQRLVDTLLAGLANCNAYLDDLIVYGTTWKQHFNMLKQVFSRLCRASPTLNLAKCDFGQTSVTYLGSQVGRSNQSQQKYLQYPNSPFPRREKLSVVSLGWRVTTKVFVGTFQLSYNPLLTYKLLNSHMNGQLNVKTLLTVLRSSFVTLQSLAPSN